MEEREGEKGGRAGDSPLGRGEGVKLQGSSSPYDTYATPPAAPRITDPIRTFAASTHRFRGPRGAVVASLAAASAAPSNASSAERTEADWSTGLAVDENACDRRTDWLREEEEASTNPADI